MRIGRLLLKACLGLAAVVVVGGCAVYSTPTGEVIAPAPVVVAPPAVVVSPFAYYGYYGSYHYHAPPPRPYYVPRHAPRYYGRGPGPRYYGRPYHRF